MTIEYNEFSTQWLQMRMNSVCDYCSIQYLQCKMIHSTMCICVNVDTALLKPSLHMPRKAYAAHWCPTESNGRLELKEARVNRSNNHEHWRQISVHLFPCLASAFLCHHLRLMLTRRCTLAHTHLQTDKFYWTSLLPVALLHTACLWNSHLLAVWYERITLRESRQARMLYVQLKLKGIRYWWVCGREHI